MTETSPDLRPDIDLAVVARVAELQCTDYEIAYAVGVDYEQFVRLLESWPELILAVESGRVAGRGKIRKRLWDKALGADEVRDENGRLLRPAVMPSERVLVFLAEQYLGMSTKVDVRYAELEKRIATMGPGEIKKRLKELQRKAENE